MKTIAGIEFPDTHEELLYLQLAHSNSYRKHILSHMQDCMISSAITKKPYDKELSAIMSWLFEQDMIPLVCKYNSNKGIELVLKGDPDERLHVGRQHKDWFYKLSSYTTESIAMGMTNGDV